MAQPLKTGAKTFDEAKLVTMAEPLTVRVEKLKGNARTPIPLPEPEDGSPAGTGWDIAGVRGLEQWLATEWSGGGLYSITVTDSSPTPITMTWTPWYDPKEYPERVPPPMQQAHRDAAQLAPVVQLPQPPMQGRVMAPAFPHGLPSVPQSFATPYYPQQQQMYYPPMPPAPVPGTPQWGAWQQEQERREREAELKRLRDESAAREREAADARHRAEIEREKQAAESRLATMQTQFQQQMQQMQQQLAQLTQQLTAAQAAPKPNAEVEAMRAALAAAEKRADDERRDREAREREVQLKEMMRQMQLDSQAQIAELRRQAEESARRTEMLIAQSSKGADPIVQLMQEQSRQQAEAMKEFARNQTMQMQQLQTQMLNPLQLMQFVREGQSNGEQQGERMQRLFSGIMDMQQRVMENALQMQPSGPGAIDLVRDGLDKVGGLVEKYVGGKQLESRLQQQTQIAMIEAQARAQHAAQHVHVTPAPAPQSQLGAPPPVQGPTVVHPATDMSTGNTQAVTQAGNGSVRRLGHTDEQWFGMLLGDVQELRVQAGMWLESLAQKPPRLDDNGEPVGMAPEEAAGVVLQAAQVVSERQIPIPALIELMFQQRYADFIDVLLPNVNEAYRQTVVQTIIHTLLAAKGQVPLDGAVPAAPAPVSIMPTAPVEAGSDDESDEETDEEDDGEEAEDGDDSVDDGKPLPRAAMKPIAQLQGKPTNGKLAPAGKR